MNKYLEKAAKLSRRTKVSPTYIHRTRDRSGIGAVVGYRTDEKPSVVGSKNYLSLKDLKMRRQRLAELTLAGRAGILALRNWKNAADSEEAKKIPRTLPTIPRGGSAGNTYASRTIHDIHKDLGVPSGFKTKSEATRHFSKNVLDYTLTSTAVVTSPQLNLTGPGTSSPLTLRALQSWQMPTF